MCTGMEVHAFFARAEKFHPSSRSDLKQISRLKVVNVANQPTEA